MNLEEIWKRWRMLQLVLIYLVNKKESMEVENREDHSIVGDECKKNPTLCTRL